MKYKVFVFTILAAVGFYNFHGIFTEQSQKVLFLAAIFISFAVAVFQGRSLRGVEYPRLPYYYVLFGIAFSAVIASITHMQGLMISIYSVLSYLPAYLFLFIFLKLDIPYRRVMDTYIVLCAISTVVYFCNVFTMPFNMFGMPIINEDLTRGIIRIPVVFIDVFPLIIFYAINKWFDTKEKKWFVLIGFATLMVFLSVIRQVIALTGVLGFLFLFRNMSLFKKFLLIAVVGVVVVFVLPNMPIYKAMIELSEDQSENNDNEEDIRIQAWRYYTYENQESPLNVVFGNGVPSAGNSIWGNIFDSDSETTGRFTHDVGWAGFFWYFGLLTTIDLIVLIVKAIMYPKPPELKFLNYWLTFILITSVASAPILYWYQVVNLMTCIGMVYCSGGSRTGDDGDMKDDDSDSHEPLSVRYNPFRRYPQLQRFIGGRPGDSFDDSNSKV